MEKITLQAVDHDIKELLEHGGLTMSNLEEFNALSWARKNLADMPCHETVCHPERMRSIEPPAVTSKLTSNGGLTSFYPQFSRLESDRCGRLRKE